ncbi:hypothetical protein [Paenarthrobacter nicotinovorans]|uniref:hypothetical protein n=1 Tax=Paenarthrobacter nicotinovorans TaxID=29320 RepID=UPI0037481E8B
MTPARTKPGSETATTSIDRQSVVARHRISLTEPNPQHVLTVGNGDFAYTADITGMQTFTDFHNATSAMMRGGTAVNTTTMSSWGWHEMPNPAGYVLEDAMSRYETARGPVSYPDKYDMEQAMRGQSTEENKPGAWLHANPQRIDLGRIGLQLRSTPGGNVETNPDTLTNIHQELDLWTGIIETSFRYAGEIVRIQTVASPSRPEVAFRIISKLLRDGRLSVSVRFPYASEGFFQTSDWDSPERHASDLTSWSSSSASILRRLDGTTYRVDLNSSASASIHSGDVPHSFTVSTTEEALDLVAVFLENPMAPRTGEGEKDLFDQVRNSSVKSWKTFWISGAAIDFSGSTDPRAQELERRTVLSQYLTAVNCSGVTPPQETGLITNSWQGKFHLEMHLWHAAHFATWGRPELLERSMPWYLSVQSTARATASRQGYPGARWPKHVGPDGRESPSPIGSLLVWQQPHPLYLLELLWRASSEVKRQMLLAEYANLVHETATFMAAFTEERDGVFHLPSPLMPAQEFYDASATENPTFELAYWWWGLEIAQSWRERAGIARDEHWSTIQDQLARPHVKAGERYDAVATEPFLRRDDHPSLLAGYGVIPPTPLIDPALMANTLQEVLSSWDWPTAWGWDFPVLAMTAARLGNPSLALDCLLKDEEKNQFSVVGHNAQMGGILPLYLPGNGSLLAAVSLLAGGDDEAPGAFPEGWTVRAEGFVPWPTVTRDFARSDQGN